MGGLGGIKVTRCNRMALRAVYVCVCELVFVDRSFYFFFFFLWLSLLNSLNLHEVFFVCPDMLLPSFRLSLPLSLTQHILSIPAFWPRRVSVQTKSTLLRI